MKLLYILILLITLGLVYSSSSSSSVSSSSSGVPPTYLLAISMVGSISYLKVIDIVTGELIKDNTLQDTSVGFPMGVFDVTGSTFKLLVDNLTNSDDELKLYDMDTGNWTSIGIITSDDSFEYQIGPLDYDPKDNSIYLTGTSLDNHQCHIYIMNFTSGNFTDTIIPFNYSVIPAGVFDIENNNFYIYYVDEFDVQHLLVYDMLISNITADWSVNAISEPNVFVFMAKGELYIIQYGNQATYIQLYSVDLQTGDTKLLNSIETYYALDDNVFAFNDDYVVFLTTVKGEGVSHVVFTTLDLNTYDKVYQSSPYDETLTMDFVLALFN